MRICVVLIAGVFVLYWPTVYHGFIDVDDPGFITVNPLLQNVSLATIIRSFSSITMLLYLPVTILTYQVDVLIAGLEPSFFHFTDLLLHAVNAALLTVILLRLTRSNLAALLCGLLFAVHPIQTEAVLWASSRKDLLSATFALLSLLSYVRYIQERENRHRLWSITFYGLGLLSKIAIFPLPLLFLILDARDGNDTRTMLREKLPYAVIATVLLVVGVIAGNQFALALNPLEVLLLAVKSTTFLLWQMIWPLRLAFLHLQREPITILDPLFTGCLVVFVGLWVTLAILLKKRIFLPALGLAMFLLLLLPTFAAAQKGGIVFFTSDKYAYLPFAGLLITVGVFVRWLEESWRSVLLPVTILILFLSGLLTLRTRSILPAWANAESIEQSVLNVDPGNAVALSNLGLLLEKQDRWDDALANFQSAIKNDPLYAVPYFNAAAALRHLGRESEALTVYENLIPMLTEREVRGDRSLQKGLVWLVARLRELGRPDLAEALKTKMGQVAPDVRFENSL